MKTKIRPFILLAFLCAASTAVLHHNPATRPATVPSGVAVTQAPVLETYGKLPLAFEANQGQTDAQVKFISRGSGYTLFLECRDLFRKVVYLRLQIRNGCFQRPIFCRKRAILSFERCHERL